MEIGLYKDNGMFPKVGKQFRCSRVKVETTWVTCTFEDIPKGKYATAIYHDENKDKICNRNLIGYPTEAYAFSMNFRPFMSPPKFANCCFELSGDETHKVKMVY